MGARDLFPVIVLITGFLLATSTWAGDGVLEINQTCAKETGCFPGDTPGYPVTITGAAGRSYRLTSDLGVSGQNTTAIEIAARDTTIDLAGFRITCTSFTPPSTLQPCSEAGPGTGAGIVVDDESTSTGVEVGNGSIFGMPGDGVVLGRRGVLRDLRVSENGGDGIRTGSSSIVSGNNVFENGSTEITASAYCLISGNTVFSAMGTGISADDGSLIERNSVTILAGTALSLSGGAGYRGNSLRAFTSARFGVNLGGNLCVDVVCP